MIVEENLPPKLRGLIQKIGILLGSCESTWAGEEVFSLQDILRSAISMEEDLQRRSQLDMILQELQQHYKAPAASKSQSNAKAFITDTQAHAYLTILPPHPGGHWMKLADIVRLVHINRVRHGLNQSAIEGAYKKATMSGEIIYALKIAQSTPPTKGRPATIDYLTRCFDKRVIFNEENPFGGEGLKEMIGNVQMGTMVARYTPPSEGTPGYNVRGELIPPLIGDPLPFEFGDTLKLAPNERDLYAMAAGSLVIRDHKLEVIPFYIVEGDLAQQQDIYFNGNVLVEGNVHGPVTIRCEDLYVLGNIEGATIYCTGDLYVRGGIIGKRIGVVEVDGRVYARFITDATVQAMEDVVATNSITYSEVISNSRILVKAERGAIVGGSISALKEIVAQSIGSDFGTYTSTTVGKDFLTPKRFQILDQKIKEYELNLAKIDLLKKRLGASAATISKLPTQRQDVLISVLQKEIQIRAELNSLKRSKDRLNQAIEGFLSACIKILDQLYPPLRVQIGEVIQEIKEKMQHVTLLLDRDTKVLTMKKGV